MNDLEFKRVEHKAWHLSLKLAERQLVNLIRDSKKDMIELQKLRGKRI
jgi:hypothetical protein